jgi:hypothetical protein
VDKENVIIIGTRTMISTILERFRSDGSSWTATTADGLWLIVEMKNSGVLALKEYLKGLSGDNPGDRLDVKATNDADISTTIYELKYSNGKETRVFPPELSSDMYALQGETRKEWGIQSSGAYTSVP